MYFLIDSHGIIDEYTDFNKLLVDYKNQPYPLECTVIKGEALKVVLNETIL